MRKLLGGVAVSSLCLILGLGITGCSSSGKGGKFAKETSVTLDAKDQKKTVDFTKDVASVDPPDQGGVKATKNTKTVTFELTTDPPTEDKSYKFKVKGKEKDEAEITVKVVGKKGKSTDGGAKETLTADMSTVTLSDTMKTATVNFTKGEPKKVDPDMKDGVTAKLEGKKVTFTLTGAQGEKAMSIPFTVEGSGTDKVTITVNVPAKTPAPPPPGGGPEDLMVMGTAPKDIKIDKTKDVEETIKFSKGKVDTVEVTPAGQGVTADGKDDWVKITVKKDAKPGDYMIKVNAKDKKMGVTIPLKVTAGISADADVSEVHFIQEADPTERLIAISRRP